MSDVDWPATIAAVSAAVIAVLTTIGAAIKYLLGHLKTIAATQHEHEEAVMRRVEAITDKFDVTVKDMRKDQQKETRETITTLLRIQSETVVAVGTLSQKVSELGIAITELRNQVSIKPRAI